MKIIVKHISPSTGIEDIQRIPKTTPPKWQENIQIHEIYTKKCYQENADYNAMEIPLCNHQNDSKKIFLMIISSASGSS